MTREIRIDPHTGTVVHIVADRQNRPNLPSTGCPFCVGGLEAPEPYTVRVFPNRWPALEPGYCEVVLYSPEHNKTFASLGMRNIGEVIEQWILRTRELRALPHGECVVIFENFGEEIGATIPHPHGQIYAFDHVPQRVATQLQNNWAPEENPGDRLVFEDVGWRLWTEHASIHPVSLRLAPVERIPDFASMKEDQLWELAAALRRTFSAFTQLFEDRAPYMLWWNQAPRTASDWPEAWLNMELVSPWRANGVPRYIAGVEVATGEYFNPVDPADVAARLREALGE